MAYISCMTSVRRRLAPALPSQQTSIMNVRGIELNVTRKPIKNLYIRVMPQTGEVHVSAPVTMVDERIAAFAEQRYPWIVRQRDRIQRARASGFREQQVQSAYASEDGLIGTPEYHERAVAAINEQLPTLLPHWSKIIGRQPSHITVRAMSSRWGSCTPRTERIRLNLQLGVMDPQFLEYVLVHEMTHLWVGGHGSGFQKRMDAYLPEWRRLRRELNQQIIW